MVTADEVQFAYPNPTNIAERSDDVAYCVGGALCLYMGVSSTFPHSVNLARALSQANPHLSYPESCDFARRIISKNDVARFDEAWLALREALKWEPNRNDEEAVASQTKAGSLS